jgi:hypothetical protein
MFVTRPVSRWRRQRFRRSTLAIRQVPVHRRTHRGTGSIHHGAGEPRSGETRNHNRRRFRSVRLTIKRRDGTTLTPTFLPARTGELIDALREHHWPIEVEVFKPRLPPAVWLALACTVVIGAGVEASLKSARSDRLTRRSLTTTAVITSMTNEGGKQRAFATYAAGPTTFTTSLIISWDKHTGDTLTLHYLPESPQKSWEQGSDPPGTDEWWLGPVVPLAIMLGARSIQVRTLRQRLVEPTRSDTTLRS